MACLVGGVFVSFNSWSTLAGEPARLPVVPCDPALFVTQEVP